MRYLPTLVLCLAAAPAMANRVFVTNEKSNDVTVLDSDTQEVIGTYPVGNRPRGITISPDGTKLYVCASDDDLVRVFDPETMEELYTLPSGPDPELFVLHPSGNPLYIANEDDNLVTVIDTQTRKVLAEMARVCKPGGEIVITNHFASEDGVMARIEKLTAPFADMLGWHSDFRIETVLDTPDTTVAQQDKLPPLGMMTFLVLRKAEG